MRAQLRTILESLRKAPPPEFPAAWHVPLPNSVVQRAMLRSGPSVRGAIESICMETGVAPAVIMSHPVGALWAHKIIPAEITEGDLDRLESLLQLQVQMARDGLERVFIQGVEDGADYNGYCLPHMMGVSSIGDYVDYVGYGALALGKTTYNMAGGKVTWSAKIPRTNLALKISRGCAEQGFGFELYLAHQQPEVAYDYYTPLFAKVGLRVKPQGVDLVNVQGWRQHFVEDDVFMEGFSSQSPLAHREIFTEEQKALTQAFYGANVFKGLMGVALLWARRQGLIYARGIPAERQLWLSHLGQKAQMTMHDRRFVNFGFSRPAEANQWFTLDLAQKTDAELFRVFDNGGTPVSGALLELAGGLISGLQPEPAGLYGGNSTLAPMVHINSIGEILSGGGKISARELKL